jgi:hypothetical protein
MGPDHRRRRPPAAHPRLDHTDRDLGVAGIPWSKNAAPNVLGSHAWVLSEIRDHPDQITLRSWGHHRGVERRSRPAAWRSAAAELLGRGPIGTRPLCPGARSCCRGP